MTDLREVLAAYESLAVECPGCRPVLDVEGLVSLKQSEENHFIHGWYGGNPPRKMWTTSPTEALALFRSHCLAVVVEGGWGIFKREGENSYFVLDKYGDSLSYPRPPDFPTLDHAIIAAARAGSKG